MWLHFISLLGLISDELKIKANHLYFLISEE